MGRLDRARVGHGRRRLHLGLQWRTPDPDRISHCPSRPRTRLRARSRRRTDRGRCRSVGDSADLSARSNEYEAPCRASFLAYSVVACRPAGPTLGRLQAAGHAGQRECGHMPGASTGSRNGCVRKVRLSRRPAAECRHTALARGMSVTAARPGYRGDLPGYGPGPSYGTSACRSCEHGSRRIGSA